jgi:hypothetical protein
MELVQNSSLPASLFTCLRVGRGGTHLQSQHSGGWGRRIVCLKPGWVTSGDFVSKQWQQQNMSLGNKPISEFSCIEKNPKMTCLLKTFYLFKWLLSSSSPCCEMKT